MPVLIPILIIIFLAGVEGVVLFFWRRSYNWKAYCASVIDIGGREGILNIYLSYGIAVPFIQYTWAHRLYTLDLGTPLEFIVLFFGLEFCYYWFHRLSHRIRLFWAHHAVHHSSNDLNLAAALRYGWTSRIGGSQLFFLPLIWLGFSPTIVFSALTLNLTYQFWLHTDWIGKLGWLEFWLNTASHHRVHHAKNPEYLDANYGGVLIIFDRLFGTFIPEDDAIPCRYGLVKPLLSNNPVIIAFHEWSALLRDLRHTRSWRARWNYLWGPPGWREDGNGYTTKDLRAMQRMGALTPVFVEE
jgi:sterol desaturase/sphingolipid hydroxylase (fatty acid hydroxylase superfamily)